MLLITFLLHRQISYPFLDGFDRERQKSKLQNYKIHHHRRRHRHHHHHHDYYYHYFLLISIFKSTMANDILLLPLFLSVSLPIFSLSKLEGLKQILPARCQRLVLVPWTTEVPCDKKAVRTLYPPDWIPRLSFFPEKKKTKTNTDNNLALHLFCHFRRKTFTFNSLRKENYDWLAMGFSLKLIPFSVSSRSPLLHFWMPSLSAM